MYLFTMIALSLGLGTAQAKGDSDLDFDLEGYYRARGYVFKDLFPSPLSGAGAGRPAQDARYMQQRLRLQPKISYEELAEFNPKGIILAGGPESVTQLGGPRAPEGLFDKGIQL